jgi:hypothetical protein
MKIAPKLIYWTGVLIERMICPKWMRWDHGDPRDLSAATSVRAAIDRYARALGPKSGLNLSLLQLD